MSCTDSLSHITPSLRVEYGLDAGSIYYLHQANPAPSHAWIATGDWRWRVHYAMEQAMPYQPIDTYVRRTKSGLSVLGLGHGEGDSAGWWWPDEIPPFPSRPYWFVTVPCWLLLLITVLPPLLYFRSLRPPRPGLCPTCSYDLRAHHPGDRCPECGTPIPAATSTK